MSFRSNRLLAQVVKSSEVKLSTKCGTSSTTVAKRSVATLQGQGQSEAKSWSQSISFASPESDFTAKSIRSVTSTTSSTSFGKGEKVSVPHIAIPTWSENISFTSPEADFTSPSSYRYGSQDLDTAVDSEIKGESWSETLSFASPESDFTGTTALNAVDEDSDVASSSKEDFINHLRNEENHRNNMAYSISYASAESDFSNPAFMNLLDDRQKKQLENCTLLHHDDNHEHERQMMKGDLSKKVNPRELKLTTSEAKSLREDFDLDEIARSTTSTSRSSTLDIFHEGPLPHTLAEASVANDPRAIVVTEAQVPFRIKMVNDSWEKLCGYTMNECQDKTLACLQGPETNKAAVTALMSQLMNGEEAGTVLTNYTKLGRKFHNRLRVGPLKNHSGEVTHFVGVLCEVNEKGEHFLPEDGHASQMAM